MNFELIFIIATSYLVGVFTTNMRNKCKQNSKTTVEECPYSKQSNNTPSSK